MTTETSSSHTSEGAKDAPGNDERLGVFDDHSSHLRVPPRTGNAMDGEATVSKAHAPAAAVHLLSMPHPSGFDGFFGGPFGPSANELPDIQTKVDVLGKVLRIHRAQMEIASCKRQQTETRRQKRQEEEKEEEECVPGTPRGNILEKEKQEEEEEGRQKTRRQRQQERPKPAAATPVLVRAAAAVAAVENWRMCPSRVRQRMSSTHAQAQAQAPRHRTCPTREEEAKGEEMSYRIASFFVRERRFSIQRVKDFPINKGVEGPKVAVGGQRTSSERGTQGGGGDEHDTRLPTRPRRSERWRQGRRRSKRQ